MSVQKLLSEVIKAASESRKNNRRKTEKLLHDVFQSIVTLRQAKRRFADELAPDFNLFDYLRNDEIGLSRCLADLLDPMAYGNRGKHGQGGLFLDTLIAHLSLRLKNSFSYWASADNCEGVFLEHPTDAGRYIDILIKFKNGGLIGIENKPWARDQANQLKDYAEYLQLKAVNQKWLLVFLSNRDPDTKSIDENTKKNHESSDHFLRLSYDEANTWLQACSEKTRAIKVRLFVSDLIKFIVSTGEG